jgi:hypothetical protein
MKKILLSVAFLATSLGFAQTLESQNFNSLIIGNVGTDFTGATSGQGSYFTGASNGAAPTTSNNSANSNFQIVATGLNGTQGLQIASPNGDKGSRIMYKDGLDAAWTTRTAGNNVIELEYDFFTGPVTDNRSQIGMRIFGDETISGVTTARTLVGFVYTSNTRALSGIAYLKNGASNGTFLISFGATAGTNLILESNTWYTVGCSYNTLTGEFLWKTSPTAGELGLGAAFWVPNMVPTDVDFVQVIVGANAAAVPPVPANTVSSNIIFDNYTARAVAISNLLGKEDFITADKNVISVYPNPAKDVLNLKVDGMQTVNAVQIVDLNGRQVYSKTFDNVSDLQINVNTLSTGMYLINITSGDKTVTKKFLKQ